MIATAPNGKTRPSILGDVNGSAWEAIELLPAAVYMTDAEGWLTFYNQAAAKLWGYRPEIGTSKFCGSWKLYWPDGTPLPHDECPMAMALQQGGPIRGMEVVAERPDGTRVPFIPCPTPRFDASGRLTGAVNMLVDISERKLAEQDKQRLAAICSSDYAVMSHDLRGVITNWSPGAERLFGYASGEIIGMPITILLPPDRYPEAIQNLTRMRRGERVAPFDTVRKRRDGSLVAVSICVSLLRNPAGEVIGASKIVHDITARKKIEAKLAERDLQLALAERANLVGSFACDFGSETMQISAGYAAIHRFPAGTREIMRSEWKAGVHHDDLVKLDELRSNAFRSRSNEYSSDYRVVRPDGEIRWVDERVFISYHDDGRPPRLVGVNIDVTGRKRGEEQQRTLLAELDHRVKNVLATVGAIAAQTKDASNSMDDFVAALDRRIQSMSSTHELLSSSRWKGVPLRELLRRELAPYASDNNTSIRGPEIVLRAEAAQTTALVLHELTTNAAKHGALSRPEGRVSVRWHRTPNGRAPVPLAIEWLETGGPPVEAPGNSGYGSSVITELVPYELGGTARLAFSPEGVHCRLEIPAKWLVPDGAHP